MTDALVITGQAPEPSLLVVDDGRVALRPAAHLLGRDPAALNGSIAGWRKALGPPWAKEHKEAAAAAWLALLRS